MSKLHGLLDSELNNRLDVINQLIAEDLSLTVNDKRRLGAEKARISKELKRREGIVEKSIPDPTGIPHVFLDVSLTRPASTELRDYMKLCLQHYPESLRYIWNKSQEYVEQNGYGRLTYAQWKRKLQNNL